MCVLFSAFDSVIHLLNRDHVQLVRIHRDRMVDEVLQLYRENGAAPATGEGDDMGGQTEDLYTSLWVQLLQQYFRGELHC